MIFLSTPSVRRATREYEKWMPDFMISIHALRAEGDYTASDLQEVLDISIHALRAEGDVLLCSFFKISFPAFLSTPSVRRATAFSSSASFFRAYFYPRPPCGGRLQSALDRPPLHVISIHALRAEGDIPADDLKGD